MNIAKLYSYRVANGKLHVFDTAGNEVLYLEDVTPQQAKEIKKAIDIIVKKTVRDERQKCAIAIQNLSRDLIDVAFSE